MLPKKHHESTFPMCLCVALPLVHIVFEEDAGRRRPRNAVAIVSCFHFLVSIKEKCFKLFSLTSVLTVLSAPHLHLY